MSTPALASVFPVIVVMRGKPGESAILNTVDDRQVFRCTEEHRSQIRFEPRTGALNVWVTDAAKPDEHPYPFQIQVAHAHLTGMSETEVEFEGVEVRDFKFTGRAVHVILTNATAGWAND